MNQDSTQILITPTLSELGTPCLWIYETRSTVVVGCSFLARTGRNLVLRWVLSTGCIILAGVLGRANPASQECIKALQQIPSPEEAASPAVCLLQRDNIQNLQKSCQFPKTLLADRSFQISEADLLRRDFVKMALDLQLFWASRVPPTSVTSKSVQSDSFKSGSVFVTEDEKPQAVSLFEKTWGLLAASLNEQFLSIPSVRQRDMDPLLKNDRCFLHSAFGRPCMLGEKLAQEFSFVSFKKAEVLQQFSAQRPQASEARQSLGLVFDLLVYQLLLSFERKNNSGSVLAQSMSEFSSADAILSYFPELVYDSHLTRVLHQILETRNLHSEFQDQVERRKIAKTSGELQGNTEGLRLHEHKRALAEQLITHSLKTRPLRAQIFRGVESLFLQVLKQELEVVRKLLRRADQDDSWILKQNRLLSRRQSISVKSHRPLSAALYKSLMCKNLIDQKDQEEFQDNLGLGLGAVALVTGGLSLLPLGATVALSFFYASMATSIFSGTYVAWTDAGVALDRRHQFLLHEISYSAVEQADREFYSDLPHVAINIALISPLAALSLIAKMERLAQTSGALAELQVLKKVKKGIYLVLVVGNTWLAYDSVKIAIPSVKRVLDLEDSTPNNEKLSPSNTENRNKLLNETLKQKEKK